MESNRSSVVIIGGGLIGLAQGIALAQAGIDVVVIDKEPPQTQLLPAFDGRVSALSLGSMRLMENLGVWSHMQPYAEPILDILVQDEGSPAFVHYDHQDIGSEPMGVILENRHIRQALQKRAEELPLLRLIAPMEWTAIENTPQEVRITLQNGETLSAQLLIAADSRYSKVREAVGIDSIHMDYKQTALVATIAHEKPHKGLAIEKFHAVGPFASLPMQGNRSSLVWVEPTARAKAMLMLDIPALEEQIQQRMGTLFGQITLESRVFSYPLHFVLSKAYSCGRVALIGDAAHGMHPIAGQGANLGYRDVATITEILINAARLGQDLGSNSVLAEYARNRQFDSASMLGVTDGLTRLFSNSNIGLKLARNMGLAAVQQLPPLKHFFMRHAMGIEGDLPPLLRKNAA